MKLIISLLLLSLLMINVHTEACEGGQWSIWFSRDLPSGSGDWEDLKDILNENPTFNCPNPTNMQVRTVGTHIAATATGQSFSNNQLPFGFSCENINQTSGTQCLDYEIRFCCPVCAGNAWTSWVSRDLPSGFGDAEGLKDLLLEKRITCDYPTIVEARVISTQQTALATGQVFAFYNAQQGFYCANSLQPSGTLCLNYEVRFCCPRCDGVWSQWFDRDNPSGVGDYEDLSDLLKENPTFTCEAPALVRARQVGTWINAFATGQKIHISPLYGFSCANSEQGTGSCLDYEVSFCCATCSRGQWSQWFDRDNPSGNGDYEDYNDLVLENPNWNCPDPQYVAARTVGTKVNSLAAGQKVTQYIPYGFNCYNLDQVTLLCLDYEVKFCCPKWFWNAPGVTATTELNNFCATQCRGAVKPCYCFNGPLPATPTSQYLCYFGFQ